MDFYVAAARRLGTVLGIDLARGMAERHCCLGAKGRCLGCPMTSHGQTDGWREEEKGESVAWSGPS